MLLPIKFTRNTSQFCKKKLHVVFSQENHQCLGSIKSMHCTFFDRDTQEGNAAQKEKPHSGMSLVNDYSSISLFFAVVRKKHSITL